MVAGGSEGGAAEEIHQSILDGGRSCVEGAGNFDPRCPELKSTAESANTLHNAGVGVMIGAGVAAAVAGAYLLLWPAEGVTAQRGVRVRALPAVSATRQGVVVLDTRITPELKQKGIARELLNRLQTKRKESGLAYDDRIHVRVSGPPEIVEAANAHKALLVENALCKTLEIGDAEDAIEVEIEGMTAKVSIKKA